jgi:hypothetical protein
MHFAMPKQNGFKNASYIWIPKRMKGVVRASQFLCPYSGQ